MASPVMSKGWSDVTVVFGGREDHACHEQAFVVGDASKYDMLRMAGIR
jgi:hypothetical protein